MRPIMSHGFAASLFVLGLLVLAALASGCYEKETDRSALPCEPGFSAICYTGPEGTLDVGECHRGQWYCWEEEGEIHQECMNEYTPQLETCNDRDDDCDGIIDNNGACSSEALSRIEAETGPTKALWRPDTIGPFLLVNFNLGALHFCPEGTIGVDCAEEFLDEYGEIFGVNDRGAQLQEHHLTTYDRGVSIYYQQIHSGVPVEGGMLSVSVHQDRVYSVLSTMLIVPDSMEVEAEYNPSQMRSDFVEPALSEGETIIPGEFDLIIYTIPEPRDESGQLPPREEQQFHENEEGVMIDGQVLAYRVETNLHVYYFDASTGEQILEEPLRMVDFLPETTVTDGGEHENLTRSLLTGYEDEVEVGCGWTDRTGENCLNLMGYVNRANVFEFESEEDDDFSVHYIDEDDDQCSVGPFSCRETSGCIENDGTIYMCPTEGFPRDPLIHEGSHRVFHQYFNGQNAQGNSLDEALAIFHSYLFSCFMNNATESDDWECRDWSFTVYRPNDAEEMEGDTRRLRDGIRGSDLTLLDSNRGDERYIYHNAFVIAFAFWRALEYFSQRSGMRLPEARRKIQLLLYLTITEQLSLWNNSIYRMEDIFAATYRAVLELSEENFEDLVWTKDEVNRVWSAFYEIGFVDCDFPNGQFFEICNDRDDNCDGLTDNCVDYETCCRYRELTGEEGCDWREQRWEHRQLTRHCYSYSEDPATEDVRPCHGGYQVCTHGSAEIYEDRWYGQSNEDPSIWSPEECTGERIPTVEECDGINNDCDDAVDEGCNCVNDVGLPSEPRDCYMFEPAEPSVNNPPCHHGLQHCVFDPTATPPWVWEDECFGAIYPVNEICNGIDDDCDGTPDNNLIDLSGGCFADTGHGRCQQYGHWECRDGIRVCMPTPTARRDETCNGVDDDCDGLIDEDQRDDPGSCGPAEDGHGPCRINGHQECIHGVMRCLPSYSEIREETCNSIDDDCDGEVDNIPGLGIPGSCTPLEETGWCAERATLQCLSGGRRRCVPAEPRDEECGNGIDDDCNGIVDDGCRPCIRCLICWGNLETTEWREHEYAYCHGVSTSFSVAVAVCGMWGGHVISFDQEGELDMIGSMDWDDGPERRETGTIWLNITRANTDASTPWIQWPSGDPVPDETAPGECASPGGNHLCSYLPSDRGCRRRMACGQLRAGYICERSTD